MALITCPECKKQMSDSAASCPNCGYQLTPEKKTALVQQQKQTSKGASITAFIILAILAFFVIKICTPSKKEEVRWQDKDESTMAFVMTQDFVEKKLKSPATAKFPSITDDETRVLKLGDQKYSVRSYVDSQNGFGAMIRTKYIAEIQQITEDQWQLISLDFDE